MREYEISGRTLIIGAVVILFALSLGAAAIVSGLDQPHRAKARQEAAQEAAQEARDAEFARRYPELQEAVDTLDEEDRKAEIMRQAKQVRAWRNVEAWAQKQQAEK